MLRLLLLLLLLANALLLAARQGWLGPGLSGTGEAEREPLRLSRQVNPGWVRVLPPSAASAMLTANAASAAEAAAAAASAADRLCLEAGPFTPAEAPAAERTLHDAGLPDAQWQALVQDDPGAYLLYMGRYSESGAVQRKLDELGKLGIAGDAMPESAALAPGIDLGRFEARAAADAALAKLQRSGVRTARVVVTRAPQRQTRLRVVEADAALRARLAGLKLPSGPGFIACAEAGVLPAVAAGGAAIASGASAPR